MDLVDSDLLAFNLEVFHGREINRQVQVLLLTLVLHEHCEVQCGHVRAEERLLRPNWTSLSLLFDFFDELFVSSLLRAQLTLKRDASSSVLHPANYYEV